MVSLRSLSVEGVAITVVVVGAILGWIDLSFLVL